MENIAMIQWLMARQSWLSDFHNKTSVKTSKNGKHVGNNITTPRPKLKTNK